MSLKIERLISKARKLAKKGKIEEAKVNYFAVLKDSPSNLEAKNGLLLLKSSKARHPKKNELQALVNLYSSGMFQKVISDSDQLIIKYENEPFLHNIKGASLNAIGDIKSSISSLEKAIDLKPDYSEALFNLGVSYQRNGQPNNAAEVYQKSINSNHAYPAAHNNLGLLFLGRNEISNAIKCFEWAIAYNSNYAEAFNNLGSALQEIKQFKSAKKQFEKATIINPNYAQAFHNLGVLCEIINLPNDSKNHYERALEIDPEFAEAYRNLSKVKKFKANDPQISQIQSIYSKYNLNISNKARLCFALAEINKDLGNDDDFFKYLDEGNSLRKKELNYSFEESQNFHKIITKLFSSSQPLIQKSSSETSDIKPIFIVGMPRSGTSLVEQIISSHNSVHGAGELLNFRNILTPILDNHLKNKNQAFSEKDMITIREEYFDFLKSLKTDEKIITDKMPMNFRLLGFILSAIPEAKIIHLKRNPMATCWSNYNHYFTAGNGFSFDQKDLSKFYALYKELMDFWHELFPGKIYDLCYEDLTINQEKETRNLLKYCELDWDKNCLDFHKNKRGVLTASSAQVRKKMYQGSSEVWKKYEKFLQPLINGLKAHEINL